MLTGTAGPKGKKRSVLAWPEAVGGEDASEQKQTPLQRKPNQPKLIKPFSLISYGTVSHKTRDGTLLHLQGPTWTSRDSTGL